jgi:class 3 adenylate cyclase
VDAVSGSWLELPTGEAVPIEGTCSIGRSHSNQLVLHDETVSRHHAVIRTADSGECWVIDLASANGTHLNRRRLDHAARLHDGDEITIGSHRLTFRSLAGGHAPGADPVDLEDTVDEVQRLSAWLLVVDIQDSTGIAQRLGTVEMVRTFSGWMEACRAILERSGGAIDKPLGDGFFAFWSTTPPAVERVAWAVRELQRLQATSALPFRMVLHLGTTFTGGQMASGTYRLFGADVNFVFRMEGLAKAIGASCLLSDPARQELASHLATTPAGDHAVPGLEGQFRFYRL